jgi:hypothetical protein
MAKPWQNHGNPWQNMAKPWQNHGKTINQDLVWLVKNWIPRMMLIPQYIS